MTDNEILMQILEAQNQLTERVNQLAEGQKQLAEGQKQLTEGQNQLTERVNQLADGQNQLFAEVKGIRQEMSTKFNEVNNNTLELLRRQDIMQNDITSMKLTLENEIRTDLKLLAEGHIGNAEQIILLRRNVEKIDDDITINPIVNDIINAE